MAVTRLRASSAAHRARLLVIITAAAERTQLFWYGDCNIGYMHEVLGWTSSLVLLLTILAQIRKQWTERSGRGVSSFLFIGQTAASLGFTVYSWLVGNWVFTFTNGLMLLSAIAGWYVTARFKRSISPRADPTRKASLAEARPSVSRELESDQAGGVEGAGMPVAEAPSPFPTTRW